MLLLVAWVYSAGGRAIVLRARSTPRARFILETATLEDAALPTLALRVTPWLPVSETAVRRLAEQIGATLELEEIRGTIVLAPGRHPITPRYLRAFRRRESSPYGSTAPRPASELARSRDVLGRFGPGGRLLGGLRCVIGRTGNGHEP